jgi:hypothetical protein
MIIIDNIFNMNALRLPLLAVVDVNNLDVIFSLVFSYYSFKSENAFKFFFNFMKEMVFLKSAKIINEVNINLLKMILSD